MTEATQEELAPLRAVVREMVEVIAVLPVDEATDAIMNGLLENLSQKTKARIDAAVTAEREVCISAIGKWYADADITASKDFNDGVRWACTHLPTYIRAIRQEHDNGAG